MLSSWSLALGSMLFSATLFAAERTEEHSLIVNADVHFVLAVHRGEVKILTGTSDTVEITARILHPERDVLDLVNLVIDASASTVQAGVELEPRYITFFDGLFAGFGGGRNYEYPEIHFTIVVPEQASLELSGHRASFDIEAPTGRITLNSHRGNGRISKVSNRLRLNTHRGDFDVGVVSLDEIDLNTHRGNIRLDIANADDYTLKGSTHRGKLHFTGKDVRVNRHDRSSNVHHVEGNGAKRVSFNTHRGNIRINFTN